MHRLVSKATSISILCLAGGAAGAELENFALTSAFSYGYGTGNDTTMMGQLELLPSLELSFSERATLHFSARYRVDLEDAIEPGRAPTENYSAASEPLLIGPTGTAEVRDLYLEVSNPAGLARFGKQQIVWGRLDGLKVLDLLNPQDFREFIIDDFEDSRISLWSAYFDYSLGDWRAELALIPDGTAHTIPTAGAWFELTAPRFRFGSEPAQPPLPIRIEQPNLTVDETGVGLRLTRTVNSAEFSLVAFSGMDPEPLGRLFSSQSGPEVEWYYERREAVGFSLDLGFGPAVFRAEYAFQPERGFNTRQPFGLDEVALDQHRGAIGFDIEGPYAIFANIQYLVDTVSDAPNELVRPAQDRLATFFLRRTFLYDTLSVEARWYRSFTDNDHMTSFSIDYAVTESLSLELAGQSFSGTRAGLFGQFRDRDRFTLTIRHTF